MRCIKTRGKKGVPHRDPDDPPRRRANKVRGHGNWENDRPPVVGTFGRDSGQVRLEVRSNNTILELQPHVETYTAPGTTVNTDEWSGYNRVEPSGRSHLTVCHLPAPNEVRQAGTPRQRVWAKDLDGDGVREVHVNTSEGFWTGLRNFLRPFRGVNKIYLQQYIAVHEWAHNLKSITLNLLRAMCGLTQFAP
jgi:transposase-like protein